MVLRMNRFFLRDYAGRHRSNQLPGWPRRLPSDRGSGSEHSGSKPGEDKPHSKFSEHITFGQKNRKDLLEQSATTLTRILQSYDESLFVEEIEEYYGHSDFANWGYWQNETHTQKEACEGLMERLLSLIPAKEGTILDVACGKGATTRYLTKYYRPNNVTGINFSQKQLQRAQKNAPGCKFLLMDATNLTFKDNTFDAVICVEAAFHFHTRRQFLAEAHRVLRPGGYFVVSDILFHPGAEAAGPMLHAQNWMPGPAAYKRLLLNLGFQNVRVINATEECARRFDRYIFNYVFKKLQSKEIDWDIFKTFMERRRDKNMAVSFYIIASGRKAWHSRYRQS